MITPAIITAINVQIGSNPNNAYEIEIPLYNSPSDTQQDKIARRCNATACYLSGAYNSYEVGDIVYVGFVNNEITHPVILGKIYKGVEDIYRGGLKACSLSVSSNATLPENTQIGELSMTQLLTMSKQIENYYNSVILSFTHNICLSSTSTSETNSYHINFSITTSDEDAYNAQTLLKCFQQLDSKGFNYETDIYHWLLATGHIKVNTTDNYIIMGISVTKGATNNQICLETVDITSGQYKEIELLITSDKTSIVDNVN